jgi:hypothetical protein
MTEDEKMQVAVFRFSVIGDFINGTYEPAREKAPDAAKVRPEMANSLLRENQDR